MLSSEEETMMDMFESGKPNRLSAQRTQSDDKADELSFFNELHSPRMMERTLSNSSFGRNHSFGGIRDFACEVKLSPPPGMDSYLCSADCIIDRTSINDITKDDDILVGCNSNSNSLTPTETPPQPSSSSLSSSHQFTPILIDRDSMMSELPVSVSGFFDGNAREDGAHASLDDAADEPLLSNGFFNSVLCSDFDMIEDNSKDENRGGLVYPDSDGLFQLDCVDKNGDEMSEENDPSLTYGEGTLLGRYTSGMTDDHLVMMDDNHNNNSNLHLFDDDLDFHLVFDDDFVVDSSSDFWSQMQDSGSNSHGLSTPYHSAVNYSGMSLLSQPSSARSNGGRMHGADDGETTINLNRPLDDSHPLFGEATSSSAQSEPPVTPRMNAASEMTLPSLPLYFDGNSVHHNAASVNDSGSSSSTSMSGNTSSELSSSLFPLTLPNVNGDAMPTTIPFDVSALDPTAERRGAADQSSTMSTTPSTSKTTMFTTSAGGGSSGGITSSLNHRNNHDSSTVVGLKRELNAPNASALGTFNPAGFGAATAGMMGPFVSAASMQGVAPFMASGMPLLPVYQPSTVAAVPAGVSGDFSTIPVPPSLTATATAGAGAASTPAVSSSSMAKTPLTDSIKASKPSQRVSSIDGKSGSSSAALATPVGNYAPQKRSKFYKKAPILEREETLRKLQRKAKSMIGKSKDRISNTDLMNAVSNSSPSATAVLSNVLEPPLLKKRTLLSHLKDVKHRKPWTRKNSASEKASGSKRNASAACETDAKSALRAVARQQRAEQAAKLKSQSTEPTLFSLAAHLPSSKRRRMNDDSSNSNISEDTKMTTMIPEVKAESMSTSPAAIPSFPPHLSNLLKSDPSSTINAATSFPTLPTQPSFVPFAAQPLQYPNALPGFPVGMETGLSFIPAPMMNPNSTAFLSSASAATAAVPMVIPQRFPTNFNSGGMLSLGLPPVLPSGLSMSNNHHHLKTEDDHSTGLPPFIDNLGNVHMSVDAANLSGDVDSAVQTGRQKTKDLKKKKQSRKNQRLRVRQSNSQTQGNNNQSSMSPASSFSESSSVSSAAATGAAAAAAGSGDRDYYQLPEPEMCWDRRKQFCCLKTHGVRRKEGEGVNKNYGIFVCQVDDDSKASKVCGRPFGQKCHWTRHCREKHVANPTRHVCVHCGNSYAQKSSLSHHIFYSHQSLTYECPHCEKTFARKATLEAHFAKKHPDFELDSSTIARTSRSPAFARMASSLNRTPHSDDASDTSTDCD